VVASGDEETMERRHNGTGCEQGCNEATIKRRSNDKEKRRRGETHALVFTRHSGVNPVCCQPSTYELTILAHSHGLRMERRGCTVQKVSQQLWRM
jgi:hypothetical protein